jgi:hypothetical protein
VLLGLPAGVAVTLSRSGAHYISFPFTLERSLPVHLIRSGVTGRVVWLFLGVLPQLDMFDVAVDVGGWLNASQCYSCCCCCQQRNPLSRTAVQNCVLECGGTCLWKGPCHSSRLCWWC